MIDAENKCNREGRLLAQTVWKRKEAMCKPGRIVERQTRASQIGIGSIGR
jgi:hypothetical protein